MGRAIAGSQRDQSRDDAAGRMEPQTVEIQARHEDDGGSQGRVQNPFRALGVQLGQKIRSGEHAGNPAREQITQDAIIHLLAVNLHGNNQDFHGDAERERRAHGVRRRDVHEENQDRRGNYARANSGNADGDRDEEPENDLHRLLALNVNAALQLVAAPASRARIVRIDAAAWCKAAQPMLV